MGTDLLPIELWYKILSTLSTKDSLSARRVCQLWAHIIQDFVLQGRIKTNEFKIRRPYEEVNEVGDEALDVGTTDEIAFRPKRPFILYGVGIHGPYPKGLTTLRNLKIDVTLEKLCKVKIPWVVLPIFFDFPIELEKDKLSRIVVNFDSSAESEESDTSFKYRTESVSVDCCEENENF